MNTDYVAALTDHIRDRALQYFPDLLAGQVDVRLVDEQKRPSASLYRFRVSDRKQAGSVIVKVPVRNPPRSPAGGRIQEKPLLFRKAEDAEMHWLQYTALVSIHEYFTSLGKKEFGAIHVLDYLPQYQAVVMEESRDPKLRQLLVKESRLRSPFAQPGLRPAFQNVGTWLHLYHTMPKKENVQVRHQRRDDYIEAIPKLTDFLAHNLGRKAFFKGITSTLIEKAHEMLQETLPLGLGHGDYAMRNILVGPQARVTVLDTFARWWTPIYEDIGYFLTGLKMTYPQVITQGLMFSQAQLRAYEHAFLSGYFGQRPIPYPAIRLYEMLTLLDKWSSVLISSYRRSARIKMAGAAKAGLASLYFQRSTEHLLHEIVRVEKAITALDPERSY